MRIYVPSHDEDRLSVYSDAHYNDNNTTLRSAILYNGNAYTGKPAMSNQRRPDGVWYLGYNTKDIGM